MAFTRVIPKFLQQYAASGLMDKPKWQNEDDVAHLDDDARAEHDKVGPWGTIRHGGGRGRGSEGEGAGGCMDGCMDGCNGAMPHDAHANTPHHHCHRQLFSRHQCWASGHVLGLHWLSMLARNWT